MQRSEKKLKTLYDVHPSWEESIWLWWEFWSQCS